MTHRSNITDKMRKYLESKINCKNVIKFIDKYINDDQTKNEIIKKLKIESVPTTVEIIYYNDTPDYNKRSNEDLPDDKWLKQLFQTYDFITEANYTGFEYFPYLYGVLNCHDNERSRVYVFYEYFEGKLTELINKIEHPSEWYDIVFQLAIINHYLINVHSYKYDSHPINYLYNKLPKPIYQKYEFGTYSFNINHKYIIVLWNPDKIVKSENGTDKIDYITNLLKYIEENKESIKIPPSGRIIKLLTDLQNNPNTLEILDQYYNPKTAPTKTEPQVTKPSIPSNNMF